FDAAGEIDVVACTFERERRLHIVTEPYAGHDRRAALHRGAAGLRDALIEVGARQMLHAVDVAFAVVVDAVVADLFAGRQSGHLRRGQLARDTDDPAATA